LYLGAAYVLTKQGTGTLTLTNPANTFTEDIFLSAGTLSFLGQGNADPTVLGSGSKTVFVTNGAVLNPTTASDPSASSKAFNFGTGGGVINLASGITFSLNDANQFAGTGEVTLTGAGTLILGQASTGYANS
jgi:autotransporter-associated beta strand protein